MNKENKNPNDIKKKKSTEEKKTITTSKKATTTTKRNEKKKLMEITLSDDEDVDLFIYQSQQKIIERREPILSDAKSTNGQWDIQLNDEIPLSKTSTNKKRKDGKVVAKKEKTTKNWTQKQKDQLTMAMHATNPTTKNFWNIIAKMVDGKSATECMMKYQNIVPSPKKTKKVSKKRKSDEKDLTGEIILKGKVGTIKRKRQIRDLVKESVVDHTDNIFKDEELDPNNSLDISFDMDVENFYEEDQNKMMGVNSEEEEEVLVPIDRNNFDFIINRINNKRKMRVTKKMREKIMNDIKKNAITPKIDVTKSEILGNEIVGLVSEQAKIKKEEIKKDNEEDEEDRDYYFEDDL
eukprot:TRINITY_DN15950_c0_g1_i1.p1 TRINITY_DN15950_c0_g1~~TRINITY_DN15950_c0_g1_i1.p1  ORF type:complete len:359 (+),score=142.25 TRINITY_DN15950_c0_g1_i1:28-1077(+)